MKKTLTANEAANEPTGAFTVTTRHKIGKVTYLVMSSPSNTATETLGRKIEKLIMKDLLQIAGATEY